jgi:hypothetical protein
LCRGQEIVIHSKNRQDIATFDIRVPQEGKGWVENQQHTSIDASVGRSPFVSDLSSTGSTAIANERRLENITTESMPQSAVTNNHRTPVDEVLQRLVKEAGPNKQLEKEREDRKDFFNGHWTQPPDEAAPFPRTSYAVPQQPVSLHKARSFVTHGNAKSSEGVSHAAEAMQQRSTAVQRSPRTLVNRRSLLTTTAINSKRAELFQQATKNDPRGRTELVQSPKFSQEQGSPKTAGANLGVSAKLRNPEGRSSLPITGPLEACDNCKRANTECECKLPARTPYEKANKESTCQSLVSKGRSEPSRNEGLQQEKSLLKNPENVGEASSYIKEGGGGGSMLLPKEDNKPSKMQRDLTTDVASSPKPGKEMRSDQPQQEPESPTITRVIPNLEDDGRVGTMARKTRKRDKERETASPPPEPADKNSEEWISWKRARLSEATKRMRKRKRKHEESGDTKMETQQRKKSRTEDGTSGPENKTRGDNPMERNMDEQDKDVGMRDEEEKDAGDLSLERWSVPVKQTTA